MSPVPHGLDKRAFLKRLDRAVVRAREAVASNNDKSFYGRGLSAEGYHGGYLEALYDVDAMLRHGSPADKLGIWKESR